jgi:hypothetical protein
LPKSFSSFPNGSLLSRDLLPLSGSASGMERGRLDGTLAGALRLPPLRGSSSCLENSMLSSDLLLLSAMGRLVGILKLPLLFCLRGGGRLVGAVLFFSGAGAAVEDGVARENIIVLLSRASNWYDSVSWVVGCDFMSL